MEAEGRQQAIAGQPPGSAAPASWSTTYTTRTSREIMDTDVRLEDAERARARCEREREAWEAEASSLRES